MHGMDTNRSDDEDTRTLLPTLSTLVQSGLQVLLWAGDADWICNWVGNYDVANALTFDGAEEFRGQELVPYTVDGVESGTFKSVGGLTFMRVFGAGHEVPYYRELTFFLPSTWEIMIIKDRGLIE
jgi:carboxypeptidase C (cathepsin A)